MQTIYGRHLEPETLVYGGLPSPAIAQFTVNSYIRAVKYSSGVTLASVTLNISNPATSPLFLSNPSVDLRWASGFYITLTDTSSKTMKVLVGAAGTGETTGSELVTGYTNYNDSMETMTVNANGHDLDSAINSLAAGACYSNATDAVGRLNKVVYNYTITGGSARLYDGDAGNVGSFNINPVSAGATTKYYTGVSAAYGMFLVALDAATNFSVLMSVKQVTAPSATGVSFSAPVVASGFLYNSASYTCTITLT